MNLRSIPKTCDHKDCNNKPTKQLCLSLAINANHKPAISTPIAYTCNEHAQLFTFEEFVNTGNNWKSLCDQFAAIGRIAPRKEFSKILVQDIDEASYQDYNRLQ